jgi:hypothetical protein
MLRHKSSWWINKLMFGRGYTFTNWIMCIETILKWIETNTINIWDHTDFGWDNGFFLVFSKNWLWELVRLSFVDNIFLLINKCILNFICYVVNESFHKWCAIVCDVIGNILVVHGWLNMVCVAHWGPRNDIYIGYFQMIYIFELY